jgi:hypothetical protein
MEKAKSVLIWGTITLGSLIMVSSFVLLFLMSRGKAPEIPALTTSASAEIQQAKSIEIANYNALTTSLEARQTNAFDYAVLKTLVPLFTTLIAAVLTYVFTNSVLEAFKIYQTRKTSKQTTS